MADSPAVAVQTSTEPTNKLTAGTNAAGGVAAVIAAVMAAYGADAIKEMLSTMPIGPAVTNLIVMVVTGIAAYFATSLSGRAAAYNVLDKPNRPLVDVDPLAHK